MRNMLSFEATPEQPGGGLLLQLAVALRQLNINPESLIWTPSPLDGTLNVRLVLSTEDRRWLAAVAAHLRGVPGVREVQCHSATDPLPPAESAGPGKGQPFKD